MSKPNPILNLVDSLIAAEILLGRWERLALGCQYHAADGSPLSGDPLTAETVAYNTKRLRKVLDLVRKSAAPAGTRPEGQDGEAGLVRSTSDAVTPKAAGAQGQVP